MQSEIRSLALAVAEHTSGFVPTLIEAEVPRLAAPLKFRERRSVIWLMVVSDICAVQIALALGLLGRHLVAAFLAKSMEAHTNRGIFLGVLGLPVANLLMGLCSGYGLGPVERLRRRVLAATATFAALIVGGHLVHFGEWSRTVELFAFVFAAVLSPLVEVVVITTLVRLRCWGTPVIVLSSEGAGLRVVEALQHRPELGLVPIGIFENEPEAWGHTMAGVPVLGPISMAPKCADYVHIAVVAMPNFHCPNLPALLERLPFPRVIFAPDLHGIQTLWTEVRDLGGTLGIEFRRNLLRKRNCYFKRTLDYAIGIPFFLASIPVIGVFALWIKLVSPGPAFYTQERVGYGGRKIRVWKLRTMYPNADGMLQSYLDKNPRDRLDWEQFFKLKEDVRILPGIGHFLRRTSLDELPQLWNILKGEMSLVGPRPFPGYHLNSFGLDFRELRQSVRPGLTGLWQISDRSDANLKMQENLDTYYIRNWSLWLDAYIVACTVKTVLMPRGAY